MIKKANTLLRNFVNNAQAGIRLFYQAYTKRIHFVITWFIIVLGVVLLLQHIYFVVTNTRRITRLKQSLFYSTKKGQDADLDKLYDYYLQEKEAYKIVTGKEYSTRKIVD